MIYRRRAPLGVFARLSNLIILQVVFIFVALVMILFFGSRGAEAEYTAVDVSAEVRRAADRISARMNSMETGRGLIEPESLARTAICGAVLYRIQFGTETCLEVERWARKGTAEDPEADHSGLLAVVDTSTLKFVAGRADGFEVAALTGARHAVHYIRVGTTDESRVVMVAAAEHAAYVDKRADLEYAIFLLFLVSTLVSLLTVYFVSKRLSEPINRLIRGLEKTAQGELFHMVECEGDREIAKLSESFNRMTRALWHHRQDMKQHAEELKRANHSLVQSQTFLATLIDCSPMSIIVTSSSGKVLLCNQAVHRDFACRGDEIIGRNIGELISPSPSTDRAIDAGSSDDKGFEAVCRRIDGDHFPTYTVRRAVAIEGEAPDAYLYVLSDISESKDFQEMIVRLNRNCTRGEMAGDIAHEINNYLAILSGNLELLPLLLKKGAQEKVEKKAGLMKETVDKIARFADGLMDSSPDETRFEPGSLNQVVENVLAFLRPQNKFDGIKVTAKLSPDLPGSVFDSGQIQQLLVNLVNNSAEAVAESTAEPVISVDTFLHCQDADKMVCVRVRDNGPGV
ncbi:MAG: HAMP domain-containing protein, partial [Candidatus Zixiibacteriota bacterium]